MAMENLTAVISRFGVYPTPDPTGHVVGFVVTHVPTGRSVYRDAVVAFSGKIDDEIVAEAWTVLEPCINMWASECDSKSPLVGATFTPTPAPGQPSLDPPAEETPVDEPVQDEPSTTSPAEEASVDEPVQDEPSPAEGETHIDPY